MGALIASVPFAAGYASPLSPTQIALACVVVVTTAGLSWLWGDRFLDSVSRALDSTPL